MREHFCGHCNVNVSDDLKYCPLCGKFVLNDEYGVVKEGKNSYPIYDLSYIYRAKWLKIVRDVLLFIAMLSVFVNLFFKTTIYWFPYVLASLFIVWKTIFFPFKEGQNHIKRIPVSGLLIALFLIFIDIYDYIMIGTELGWALVFTSPAVLTGTIALSLILALSTSVYDVQLIRGIVYLEIISVVVFVLRLFFFKNFVLWPAFMMICSASISLFVLFMAKRRRMIKEINRNFHI